MLTREEIAEMVFESMHEGSASRNGYSMTKDEWQVNEESISGRYAEEWFAEYEITGPQGRKTKMYHWCNFPVSGIKEEYLAGMSIHIADVFCEKTHLNNLTRTTDEEWGRPSILDESCCDDCGKSGGNCEEE